MVPPTEQWKKWCSRENSRSSKSFLQIHKHSKSKKSAPNFENKIQQAQETFSRYLGIVLSEQPPTC